MEKKYVIFERLSGSPSVHCDYRYGIFEGGEEQAQEVCEALEMFRRAEESFGFKDSDYSSFFPVPFKNIEGDDGDI